MLPVAMLASLLGTVPVVAQSQSTPIFGSVAINPGFSPDPLAVQGKAGGNTSARLLAGQPETPTGPCAGFADTTPNHTLVLGKNFSYLSLEVDSEEDTALVIQGPGGSWCNDDFRGKNPNIAGQWLAGTYKIWVTSYRRNTSSSYTLKISQIR